MVQKFFLISYFLFLISYSGFSQDSCHLRISFLTCSPGEELYSTFGHSAMRVTDSATNEDIVYNYGTFDFDEPGFYTKFIRGKLMYYLSTDDFNSFRKSFQQDNRGIIEQELNLSCNEKRKMVQLLQQNLMGDNKFYKYDFLFDNCTTRLRDLLERSSDLTVHYSKIVKEKTRFRQLIYQYLDYNDKQWSKLGIDLLLGAKTDAVMTDREVLFLPDYLLKGFDSSRIGNKNVVSSKNTVVNYPGQDSKGLFFTDPLFIFSLLFVLILLFSFSKNLAVQNFLIRFDGLIFFITGLIGIVILFMWFGTDHVMTKNNYNLLWSLPTNSFMAFFVHSKKNWPKKYFRVILMINILLLVCWFFLPQHLNTSLIPIILILVLRSYYVVSANLPSNHAMSKRSQ